MHRISDFRFGGITRQNFKMFKELCGENALKNVVIVTTMWSEVTQATGADREVQLKTNDKFFKPALDKQAQMLRHNNTIESAQAILRAIMHNHPISLKVQEEVVDQHKPIGDTGAAHELNREMEEKMRLLEEERRKAQEEKDRAIKEQERRQKEELRRAHEERLRMEEQARLERERELARQRREEERQRERLLQLEQRRREIEELEERRREAEAEARARAEVLAEIEAEENRERGRNVVGGLAAIAVIFLL
jgi:hypothetical protein